MFLARAAAKAHCTLAARARNLPTLDVIDQTIRSLSWDAEFCFGYSEYPFRSSFSSFCFSIIDESGYELELLIVVRYDSSE